MNLLNRMIARASRTASHARATFRPIPSRCILLVTLHKSGSHLVSRVLKLAGLRSLSVHYHPVQLNDFRRLTRSRHYLVTHDAPGRSVYGGIEEGTVKAIFNFRDPRDVAVSNMHYLSASNPKQLDPFNEFLKSAHAEAYDNDKALLDAIIKADNIIPYPYDIRTQFYLSRGLLHHPNVLNVRFEDLVGSRGGESDERQLQTVANILEFLSLDCDAEQIAAEAYDRSATTFRKGTTGQWRTTLTPEQVALFNRLHGDLLLDYGYSLE